MEIIGNIDQINPIQSGESKNGVWRKQLFILKTEGDFSRTICFSVWGDRIDEFNLLAGTRIKVFFNLISKEYNSKWFTEAKVWKIDQIGTEKHNTYDEVEVDDDEIILPF